MANSVRKALVAGLLICGMTGSSLADVLFVGSKRTPSTGTNVTFEPVALIDTGSVTVGFSTAERNVPVVITYNAECSRIGSQGSVAIQIVVDDKVIDPKSPGGSILCSGEKIGASRQSHLTVPKDGFHDVRVNVAAVGGATGWTLDASSILIED